MRPSLPSVRCRMSMKAGSGKCQRRHPKANLRISPSLTTHRHRWSPMDQLMTVRRLCRNRTDQSLATCIPSVITRSLKMPAYGSRDLLYEIQPSSDGDGWIRRPYGKRGRLPGIPWDDWPGLAHKDALWKHYIESDGAPPPVPDPKGHRGAKRSASLSSMT